MAYERDARTAFAGKALELSEMFMVKFGQRTFRGSPTRVVQVQEPGESTGGGAQAREPIALVPAGGVPGPSIVVGWINVGENKAEVRSFAVLAEMHRQRHGPTAQIDLDRNEYESFLADVRAFFAEEEMPTRVVDDAPASPAAMRQATGSAAPVRSGMGGAMVVVLAIVAIVLGLGIGWLLFAPK
jgi:hypothetical protein